MVLILDGVYRRAVLRDKRKDRRLYKPVTQCGRQRNQGISGPVSGEDGSPGPGAQPLSLRAAISKEGVCFLTLAGMQKQGLVPSSPSLDV